MMAACPSVPRVRPYYRDLNGKARLPKAQEAIREDKACPATFPSTKDAEREPAVAIIGSPPQDNGRVPF